MKKSIKSFKAINENKKQTVKGGNATTALSVLGWSYSTLGKCRWCPAESHDH